MNCRICGAELPEGAMFCGECGSSTSATPESRRRVDPRPGDTTVIEGGAPRESGVISVPVTSVEAGSALSVEPAVGVTDAEPGDGADTHTGADTDDAPATAGWAPGLGGADAATAGPGAAARFVLRFTTGETRTVFGTGLIGRRPMPQPGESYDHLVQIADRSLSVSKTHLEFGAYADELWVADRFSANGTVVHRPDVGAVRCEPGRRYLVPRGSRVEIAEHSFRVE